MMFRGRVGIFNLNSSVDGNKMTSMEFFPENVMDVNEKKIFYMLYVCHMPYVNNSQMLSLCSTSSLNFRLVHANMYFTT